MEEFKKNSILVMKVVIIISSLLISGLVLSCKKDEISPYRLEDSAVEFFSSSNNFSMKGVTSETIDFEIPVKLYGPKANYSRPISLVVNDVTANQGVDYEILSSQVDSGALAGKVLIRVKILSEGTDLLETEFTIQPNEHFRAGVPDQLKSRIIWSKQYVRPRYEVWRYWFLFFSNGYSQAYHESLYQFFGEEIEYYTNSMSYAKKDPKLIYKSPSWWFSATRAFREHVKNHDDNNAEPLRHSPDYEKYATYTQAYGSGDKPDTTPTILETLNIL